MVRLWNPYVPNKPITVLEGHYSAVIDVVIYEYLEQVFSYSADAVRLTSVLPHANCQAILFKDYLLMLKIYLNIFFVVHYCSTKILIHYYHEFE